MNIGSSGLRTSRKIIGSTIRQYNDSTGVKTSGNTGSDGVKTSGKTHSSSGSFGAKISRNSTPTNGSLVRNASSSNDQSSKQLPKAQALHQASKEGWFVAAYTLLD